MGEGEEEGRRREQGGGVKEEEKIRIEGIEDRGRVGGYKWKRRMYTARIE